ncbi:MAG: ParB/RepB/Spo0J family partition protein [Oscillatoria sp. SIO1A7]|nr:ParB/RepB/Spo0J family partition protein [Oscillatoria sp. SIO1A7]
MNATVKNIPLELIKTDWAGPVRLDIKALSELKKSIEKEGVQTPIWVWEKQENEYWLVSGQHRYECSNKLGLKTIPSIVKQIKSDAEALFFSFLENQRREKLDAYEKLIISYRYIQARLKENEIDLSFQEIQQLVFKIRRESKNKRIEEMFKENKKIEIICNANEDLNIWKLNSLSNQSVMLSYAEPIQEALVDGLSVAIATKIHKITTLVDKRERINEASRCVKLVKVDGNYLSPKNASQVLRKREEQIASRTEETSKKFKLLEDCNLCHRTLKNITDRLKEKESSNEIIDDILKFFNSIDERIETI